MSIDLEVGTQDRKIHAFAAVRPDGRAYAYRHGDLPAALCQLDDFVASASFLLGHNFVSFDRVHLAAAKPDLRLLALPPVDTLLINPLAFPRNPYHHLVKHYHDGKLQRGNLNDPELDARLTLDVFRDQADALRHMTRATPWLLTAWHWLTTHDGDASGLDAFFTTVRGSGRPTDEDALTAIDACLAGQGCTTCAAALRQRAREQGWPLSYALAWLSVAGGNSVMPPWVRHRFPEAGHIVRRLRDVACHDPDCAWCAERHDARKELRRLFGFSEFRPYPADEEGRPLQEKIVEAALAGKHVLGILPTGTGKSLCYQVPALSRYEKTGALTVVISPLVALMADQVAGLEARNIGCSAAINGLLSLPERADVLDRVRLGDVGILIIAPEQLRSKAVRNVLAQREIGMWVLDEAHCLSKWGHAFRPDYRYVGRFIRASAADAVAPVLCLTATAKPEVVADMLGYFRDKVGIELELVNGGAQRDNLDFQVLPTTPSEKFAHVHQLLANAFPPGAEGGAIVYCASRKQTEEVAEYLREQGMRAAHFHAGLAPESKKDTQKRFVGGELQVIAATNAFGMGIDKSDVRLVVHADMPGSLENYLQEAGRAGRDRAPARCVLLYTAEDVERQFGMSAHSRLSQREIQSVLKSLRRLERKKQGGSELIATTGEILSEEVDGVFERDAATDDTRVRTALSWLEEAALLQRDENRVQIFPSSLQVGSLQEAEARIAREPNLFADYRRQLLAVVRTLIAADPDDGISTDELMGISGLTSEKIRTALYDLERLGIASNDTALTAFVHAGTVRSSGKRLEEAAALESALIDRLREAAPDLHKGDSAPLQLRHVTQALKDAGHAEALPERILRILNSIAADGRSEDDGSVGSIRLRRLDAESVLITLQREWAPLAETAERRRQAAACALQHLLDVLPSGARGTDLLAETSLGKLHDALRKDVVLASKAKHLDKLLDRALLWLHEQEIIRLNKGLAVFRSAMTIRLSPERRNFAKADFTPLKMHYDEQVAQIHVMAEYVRRGLDIMAEALKLAFDYFRLDRQTFLDIWLPGKHKELERQTTPASWAAIVDDLRHPQQQRIVADDREQTNVLVLAGPGSGKTRVLVHRIAYLIRVRRENPHGILALAYNRHAAQQIRQRLADLVGDDARGVVVMTCHAFAMRLTGTSFRNHAAKDEGSFKQACRDVMAQAIALLKGDEAAPEEADTQRDRLLAGFRWILVDEYQDIGPEQYELIAAVAGRTRSDEDGRLTVFAVGDDDQNIYAFDGASVEFIRRFENDYAARPVYLTENFRSTLHIVDAANRVIAAAPDRMKAKHPIGINQARLKHEPGGAWARLDPVAQGRVQILPTGDSPLTQAVMVVDELRRLASLDPDWDWTKTAVIAREWKALDPVRSYCELRGIPVQMADDEMIHCWHLRETRQLIDWLRGRDGSLVGAPDVSDWLAARHDGPWWALLRDAVEQYGLETAQSTLPREHFIDWLSEWGREVRRRQRGLLLLTAHRAKGLEFDHVAVLDGGWRAGNNEDPDAPRRLFYVAMTRARHTLALATAGRAHRFAGALQNAPCALRRELPPPGPIPDALARRYVRTTLKDVDLDFTGRQPARHPVHDAVARLAAGAPVELRQVDNRWQLLDADRQVVGRLAQAFAPPQGMRCVAAHVHAVIVRRREDSQGDYQRLLQCEQWEVVLPELIFEPQG